MNTPEKMLFRTPQEVSENKEKFLLIDLRTPAEYQSAHIDNSVLHPISDFKKDQISSLLKDGQECLLICQSGNRAKQAAKKLEDAEFPFCILEGGVKAWEQADLPLNKGAKTISLERQVRIVAGALVLITSLLGYFLNPLWVFGSAFVGAGLIFAGVTDTCGMALVLARMPWNSKCSVTCNLSK